MDIRRQKSRHSSQCQTCRDSTPGVPYEAPLRVSLWDLARAHERGCNVCSLCFRGLLALHPTALKSQLDKITLHFNRGSLMLDRFDNVNLRRCRIRFEREGQFPSPWESLLSSPITAKRFGSTNCLSRAKFWITDCEKNHTHPICRKPAAAVLPTRIIDLGTQGQPTAILVESGGMTEKYMALSHCWGKTRNFVTTKDNIHDMKQGFLVKELPQTFRDAISVARFLGIRYLWIDSICIIQGDRDDWEREVAKMSTVYSNAFVTLAASSSASDMDGFLHERPDRYYGKTICSQMDVSSEGSVRVREEIPHASDNGKKPSSDNPLEHRAWALQEDVLSRRFLSFETGELAWDCAAMTTCECGGKANLQGWRKKIIQSSNPGTQKESDQKDSRGNLSRHSSIGRRDSVRPFTNEMNREQLHRVWLIICVQYSQKQLSQAGDKLPALSGLADRYRQSLADLYLAGLWRGNLLPGLLWRSNKLRLESRYEMTTRLPPCWRAPSWSWASIDGQITYDESENPQGRFQGYIKVKESECQLSSANATGCVTGGFIKLEGRLVQAFFGQGRNMSVSGLLLTTEFKHATADRTLSSTRDFLINVKPDVPFRQVESVGTDGTERVFHARSHSDVMDFGTITAPVDCLVVASKSYEHGQWLYLLMLGASETTSDAYERLGLIECDSAGRGTISEWFLEAPLTELTLV